MIFLEWEEEIGHRPRDQTVVLFGAGLIGQAVASRIASKSGAPICNLPFDWSDNNTSDKQLEQFRARIVSAGKRSARHKVSFVWSAGAGGFGSAKEVFEQEIAVLNRVLSLCESVHCLLPDSETSFHLLSSAGGVFEGQRNVGRAALPLALRPYSDAKLVQEGLVRALPTAISTHIYRPSSVYGFCPGGRLGLPLTLIRNGYQLKTTKISGSPSTLRDYVHVSDVGRFIGDRIVRGGSGSGTHILASGKPTSMNEMIRLVERVIDRHLYLQFDSRPTNAQDNTYLPSALGEFSAAISLPVGIRQSALAFSSRELV